MVQAAEAASAGSARLTEAEKAEMGAVTSDLALRAMAVGFSPFHPGPDGNSDVPEDRRVRSENRQFGQVRLSLDYDASAAIHPGIHYFYNGGADVFHPQTALLIDQRHPEFPDRDVYDLRRGTIRTHNAHFVGITLTGDLNKSFAYEFLAIGDTTGAGLYGLAVLKYRRGNLLALSLGVRAYSSESGRASDYKDKPDGAFVSLEAAFF